MNARLARDEGERVKIAVIDAERLKRQKAFDEALERGAEERRLKAEQAKALQAAALQQVFGSLVSFLFDSGLSTYTFWTVYLNILFLFLERSP